MGSIKAGVTYFMLLRDGIVAILLAIRRRTSNARIDT